MTNMQDYREWTKGHLKKNATPIHHTRPTEVKEEGLQLLKEKRHILSNREARTIEQAIKSHAVPTPKLLIKDHKKADKNGNFPTRLVVPATNFTSSFPKAGYLGIKKIFDDNKVNYMERTIIQASDLKEEIEKLGITSNNTTIVSIDAEAYYPSIKLKLVRKAIQHFSKGLKRKDRTTIEHCIDMIKFGMCNTLITFEDQYYEYDGGKDPEEKGLTIGGYESAWLADLVGAYILDKTQQHFTETSYHGLYRDDGFATFNGKWDYDMIVEWRDEFQKSVNILAGGDYLQFTCSIWLPNGKTKEYNKMVSIERGN